MGNTTATYEEVKAFLDQMKTWLSLLGGHVIYEKREKNDQFMASTQSGVEVRETD